MQAAHSLLGCVPVSRSRAGEGGWWFRAGGAGRGVCGQPCLFGGAEGLALEGKCRPQQRPGEFNSSSGSKKSLVKEWRLQPRCWWPGTGRTPLPSAEMMLQTFQLPVKQAAAFGWGFASTPLLSSSPFLCKPSLRCFSPGEAMRWGC